MAGKLYVDEIRDTATTGSPSFPNGLDITELTDPIGSEGEVLTVQADGSILAAAAGGGGGWPMPVAVADVADAQVIGDAMAAALGVVGTANYNDYFSTVDLSFLSPAKNDGAAISGSYQSGSWLWNFTQQFTLAISGAGTLYLTSISFGWGSLGPG